jgi:hypothetical protein
MKQKQILNKREDKDYYSTIRLSRKTLDALSKRGRYKDTHEMIIQRLLSDAGSKLDPSEEDGGSF